MGATEAFPGTLWGELCYINNLKLICWWWSGHRFLFLVLSNLSVPCFTNNRKDLICASYFVGRIFVGGRNDQDKSPGFEG